MGTYQTWKILLPDPQSVFGAFSRALDMTLTPVYGKIVTESANVKLEPQLPGASFSAEPRLCAGRATHQTGTGLLWRPVAL